ncbi:hypothetical protein AcW1_001438 [Taiwanofungus camphoratus]|nr:hypothetical protein AcW1_001438 [Antrodia cinnamomea]
MAARLTFGDRCTADEDNGHRTTDNGQQTGDTRAQSPSCAHPHPHPHLPDIQQSAATAYSRLLPALIAARTSGRAGCSPGATNVLAVLRYGLPMPYGCSCSLAGRTART